MKQWLMLILVPCLLTWIDGSPEGPPQYGDPSGYDPNQYYSYMSNDQLYRDYLPPVTPPNIPGGPPSQVGPGGSRPAAPPMPNGNIPDPNLPGPPLPGPPMPGPPMPGPPMPGPPMPGPPMPGPPMPGPPMPGPSLPSPPMTGPFMPYPEIPQFYFNAGFNKGTKFDTQYYIDMNKHQHLKLLENN